MTYDIVLDPNTMEVQADKFGDFLLGENSNNCALCIVVSNPGDWKEFPLLGVGIYNYIQAITSAAAIEQAIIRQLKQDVFPNPVVSARKFPTLIINTTKIELSNGNTDTL